jgi:glycosyltransferase involved in cell wall biosynthesis
MKYSVVIPTYNMAQYLVTALHSVAKAAKGHEPELEVVVVDDASTDDTQQVLAACQRDAGFAVHVLRHPANRGSSAAKNTGIRHAQGDYVLLLDADNTVGDAIFSHLNAQTASHPEADVFVLGMGLIDAEGAPAGIFYRDVVQVDVAANLLPRSLQLLHDNFMDNFSLVKRSVLLDNPFDENFDYLEDWDLWIRLNWIRQAQFQFVPELLGGYRIIDDSKTRQLRKNDAKNKRQLIRLYSKMLLSSESMGLSPQWVQQVTQHVRQLCSSLI